MVLEEGTGVAWFLHKLQKTTLTDRDKHQYIRLQERRTHGLPFSSSFIATVRQRRRDMSFNLHQGRQTYISLQWQSRILSTVADINEKHHYASTNQTAPWRTRPCDLQSRSRACRDLATLDRHSCSKPTRIRNMATLVDNFLGGWLASAEYLNALFWGVMIFESRRN